MNDVEACDGDLPSSFLQSEKTRNNNTKRQ